MTSKINNKNENTKKKKNNSNKKVSMYKAFERYIFCMHRKQV